MFRIAVASGKGGTGKTFVSVNLFHVMERIGRDAAIVDCDAEVPNASIFLDMEKCGEREVMELCPEIRREDCTFCGTCADWCSYNAIVCIPAAGYIRVMPDICHGCGACLHACSQGAVVSALRRTGSVTSYGNGAVPRFFESRIVEGVHSPVNVIREAVTVASGCGAEYLILDSPPGCACPFVSAVAEADYVVLVTEPTPFGLSDLKHAVSVLRMMGKDFGVVVNRSDMGNGELREWLECEGIEIVSEIPYSEKAAETYACGGFAVDSDAVMNDLFLSLTYKILDYESSGSQR